MVLILLLALFGLAQASCCSGGKTNRDKAGSCGMESDRTAIPEHKPAATAAGSPVMFLDTPATSPDACCRKAGSPAHDSHNCQAGGGCQGRCGCACFAAPSLAFRTMISVQYLPTGTGQRLPEPEAVGFRDGYPQSITHPPR
jgi:hypothetical protein